MREEEHSQLRKQAWDYFTVHASQRMTIFNFYIVLSSVVATSFFASFKSDSNLQSARPILAALLCFFAFIFWKLDQRNKVLIKNAERALKFFEQRDPVDSIAKVFTQEEIETKANAVTGWRWILCWRWNLSYSSCFNLVFVCFFLVGFIGIVTGFFHGAVETVTPAHIVNPRYSRLAFP